jgi:MFS family permease
LKGLGNWILLSSGGFGATLILFGISKNFWLSVAVLVPVGYCMMVQMASSNTLIQSMVPDRLRGRVMAVYSMMFMGMAPIGALGAGVVAAHLGAPLTLAIGGLACMLGAAAFGMRLPVMRVEARRLIIAQGLAGGDPAQEIVSQEVSGKA